MRAPSWPATSAMSARSASSVTPVSAARLASAVHGAAPTRRALSSAASMRWKAHPAADLGRGLQRLGRPGAGAPLQRHQVEVAAQRVPEVVALLGRVDVGDQVGGEEQDHPADQRGADRDLPVRRRAAQGQHGRQQHRGGQAEQAARHLAGQPGGPVLAQDGQVGGGHREPGQHVGQPPAQPLGGRRTGGVPGRPVIGLVQPVQRRVDPRARRDQLGQRDEHAQAGQRADHHDPGAHHGLPDSAPTPRAAAPGGSAAGPAAGGPVTVSSRNRPGAGTVPSRLSQNSPPA